MIYFILIIIILFLCTELVGKKKKKEGLKMKGLKKPKPLPDIGKVFKSIGSHLKCGTDMIKNLPSCFFYYILQIIANVLYLPIAILFWITRLQWLEKKIGNMMEGMDKSLHSYTSMHIIHLPDSVQKKCFSCKITPMPK